jgi:cystathionine beta-lyase/cystathionine gamma-synthase
MLLVQVVKVHYPGLASHPQHQQLSQVFTGFGGVFAFELDGGVKVADAFMEVRECSYTLTISSQKEICSHVWW